MTAKIVTQVIFLVRVTYSDNRGLYLGHELVVAVNKGGRLWGVAQAPAHVSRHGADLWSDCPQWKEGLFDRPYLCLVDFASFLFSSSSVLFVTSP